MTNEEAIKHLEFMAKGYQNLLDNDERCLEAVGKGYKGEVEAQESLADVYKMQIEVLNVAIKALQEHKTGHWVEENINEWSRKIFCSECGCPPPFEHVSTGDVYSASGYGVINKTKFCPNCGARMERTEDENNR